MIPDPSRYLPVTRPLIVPASDPSQDPSREGSNPGRKSCLDRPIIHVGTAGPNRSRTAGANSVEKATFGMICQSGPGENGFADVPSTAQKPLCARNTPTKET